MFERWGEGLRRNRSLLKGNLSYRWMRKPGSQTAVSSLHNGSHSRRMKVSNVCLENRELSESASECFQITPSLSLRVSVCPQISVYSYLSLLSLFLVTVQLCLLCFLRAVSLLPALFHGCVPDSSSAFLPSSHRLSTLPDPNMSVLLNKCPEVPYEVTLPLCFISKHVWARLRSQQWLRKIASK